MNKYTLGTILGAATLGMMKYKIGSGIKLALKQESFDYVTYRLKYYNYDNSLEDYYDDIKSIVDEFLVDYPMYKALIYTAEDPYEVNDGEWATQYFLDIELISKTVAESQEINDTRQNISQAASILQNKIWRSDLQYDEMIEEDDWWNQTETILYNVETGEKYKKPKPNKTNLRVR